MTVLRAYRELLRDPRIRLVWLGELVNAFGSGLTFWALAWLLYRQFPAQPLLMAALLSVLSVSTLAGSLLLGAFLDRWDRRRVLLCCNLALALATALLPVLIGRGQLGPVTLLVAGMGVLRSLPAPALAASLPALTSPGRFPRLHALFTLTWTGGELLAPVAAGVLIGVLGAAPVLWLDALTFVLAAGVYLLVRFPAQPARGALVPVPAAPVGSDAALGAGWQHVLGSPPLLGVLLGVGSTNAFFETFGAVFLPRLGERLLGVAGGPLAVGLLDSCILGAETAVGLWLGTCSIPARLLRPLIALSCAGSVVLAAGLVLAPGFPAAVLLALLVGAACAPLSALLGVYVVRQTPAALRGRVGSVQFFCTNAGRPLALMAAGALVLPLGVGPLVLAVGGAALLSGLGGHLWGGRPVQGPPAGALGPLD